MLEVHNVNSNCLFEILFHGVNKTNFKLFIMQIATILRVSVVSGSAEGLSNITLGVEVDVKTSALIFE